MGKEKVLEIEITKINEKWSVGVVIYQDTEILKRGKFVDNEICVKSINCPQCSVSGFLFIKGESDCSDSRPFLIENELVPSVLEKVEKINEKYGKPKRWRAEKSELYFFLDSTGEINWTNDYRCRFDDEHYNIGNYFKIREDVLEYAEKFRELFKEVEYVEV